MILNLSSCKKTVGIIILMLSPFFVQVVQGQMPDPVSYSVTELPDRIEAGEVFTVTVRAELEGKWHLYSINNDPDAGPYPTQFSSANDRLSIAGEIKETEPVIERDPNFNIELGWHTGEATFRIPLVFRDGAQGSSMIDLEVLYQVCDDKICLPPRTKSIMHPIEVSGAAEESPAPPKEEESGADTTGAPEGDEPDEDVTGYTCTSCRAMEADVFPLEPIQKRFAKMQQVRLYTENGTEGPENQKFRFELTER